MRVRRAASRVPSAAAARLAAALGEAGCPVCRCLEADARRDLGAFLREQTMDPAGRAALRAAGGFCAWHTALLREAADGILSVALLAEDLLAAPLAARATCPACAGLRDRAGEYLTALLDTGATAWPGAACLPCRPHLRALRARAPRDPRLAALDRAMAPRIARVRSALTRFIAKQDYQAASVPTDDETRAWSEGLEHLAGRPGLFGSDLTRE